MGVCVGKDALVAQTLNKLSDKFVRNAPIGMHGDGGGLWLQVKGENSASWIFRWRQDGKGRYLGIGPLTSITLAKAREIAAKHRETVALGTDPAAERDKGRREMERQHKTFRDAYEAFFDSREESWKSAKHSAQFKSTLESYAAALMPMKLDDITQNDVQRVLKPIWHKVPETARRVRQRIAKVIDYAIAADWRSNHSNPADWKTRQSHLLPSNKPEQEGHFRALDYAEVPAFMKALRAREALAARALELVIATASRTSEVLSAEWPEFDLDAGLWHRPAVKMKAGRDHTAVLPPSAVKMLRELQAVGADGVYAFPGGKKGKPLSNMSMLVLLDRMNMRSKGTVHGMRSAFKDFCHEQTSFPTEVVEMALAHVIGDKTERAYRRGELLEKRKALALTWDKFLNGKMKVATHRAEEMGAADV